MNKKFDLIQTKSSRRSFLKIGSMLGLGAGLDPSVSGRFFSEKTETDAPNKTNSSSLITLLITADIHAQLHPHDEFFWENEQAIFRKRGGMAVLKNDVQHAEATESEQHDII